MQEKKMNRKTFVRAVLYCLAALMLVFNSTGVSASPVETLTGKVFTVSPTGVDDTANILKAFADAKKAGAGSTVQFTAGIFKTDLIHVVNFKGYFKGMGQDKTIITPLLNLPCKEEAIDKGFIPMLFRFSEGSIHVSNLTIKFDTGPCVPYTFGWWPDGQMTTALYGAIYFGGPVPVNMTDCAFIKKGKVEGTVDRVSVLVSEGVDLIMGIYGGGDYQLGGTCDGYGYNVDLTLKITHSYVERAWNLIGASNIDGGSIVFQGNTLHEGGTGIFISDDANAPVLIADNILENQPWNSIFIAQGLYANILVPVAPAMFIVRNNTLRAIDYANDITLIDNTDYLGENQVPRMKVVVESNKIEQDGMYTWGIAGFGVHNAKILNNRFSGQGESAIVNGYPTGYGNFDSARWLIQGNDVSTIQPYPPATTMNKIVLGEFSHDCLAIVASADDVLNLGTDNTIMGRLSQKGLAPALQIRQKQVKPFIQGLRGARDQGEKR
jgi:hypothetical protein